MSELKCVVVTPEQTELDVTVQSVTLPMFDGEMGILKGHSPLVGRLGYGVLRIQANGGPSQYFIEGGFVQVAADVVSVLTDRLIPMSEVTQESANSALKAALEMPTDQPDVALAREKAIHRARAMIRVVSP
ncbi:MAG: ATP synthase F1 subunit epsilon [bacterium]|nr:ATP synthase F1 subunit epsilon [bacterium]